MIINYSSNSITSFFASSNCYFASFSLLSLPQFGKIKMNSAFVQKTSDSDEDPVEQMLKKTGCIELHYKVQVNIRVHSILHRFNQIFFIFRSVLLKLKIGESARTQLKNSERACKHTQINSAKNTAIKNVLQTVKNGSRD